MKITQITESKDPEKQNFSNLNSFSKLFFSLNAISVNRDI
jgi:hypothetical protein